MTIIQFSILMVAITITAIVIVWAIGVWINKDFERISKKKKEEHE